MNLSLFLLVILSNKTGEGINRHLNKYKIMHTGTKGSQPAVNNQEGSLGGIVDNKMKMSLVCEC